MNYKKFSDARLPVFFSDRKFSKVCQDVYSELEWILLVIEVPGLFFVFVSMNFVPYWIITEIITKNLLSTYEID